ncbi:hypothetical protein WS45_28770 [Burkholderia sp. RF2-non_BP3]|nr:hypothetical protein WS45_28770 [Burkholderia sp. RF2-non_BP3]
MLHQTIVLAAQMLGYPRHPSQHSGGFVISRSELTRLVPLEDAAMDDRTIIQWNVSPGNVTLNRRGDEGTIVSTKFFKWTRVRYGRE